MMKLKNKGLAYEAEARGATEFSMNSLKEKDVVSFWKRLLLKRADFVAAGGEGLRVIFPGRINDSRGADFCDAVIATGQGLRRGHIEVHINSRDWKAHRHHQDAAYNRVILHVAMWHGTGAATRLQNGKTIPVVVLSNYMEDLIGPGREWIKGKSLMEESGASVHRGSGTSCFDAAECLDKGALGEILESAGEERFMAKAAVFEAEFDHIDAGQVLYQGIMCALGYSRNKLPFLELARRLPLKILESIVQQNVSDEECLARQQALLLGVAGLLPSTWQREYQGLELDSQAKVPRVRSPWPVRVMSATDWQLFKVRPSNSPVRRIAAMSYLVLRCRERGMLEELIDVVKRAPESEVPRLEESLIVTAGGYRAGQFDFGGESRAGTITLLGAERAAVIMVNIILPFACAWSRANSRPELGEKALRLYRHYPRLGENTVERHMREQLGLSPFLVNSACRQQGLIHVYKTLCVRGRCNSCPVSQNVSHAYHG
jgi:hypothetical protein